MIAFILNYITTIFRFEEKYSKVSNYNPNVPYNVGDKYSNKNMTKEKGKQDDK